MTVERSPERDAAVTAALPHVPSLGWTAAALEAGLRDLGEDPMAHRWLFPRGPVGAIEAWFDLRDRQMEEAARGEALETLRIPDRIRALVRLRLAASAPHREALRRALATLSAPWNAPMAARALGRTADAMWAAAGDRSSDFSWYTRRASLAAIYAATLGFWLRGPVADDGAALDFLDRRLAGLARLQGARRRSAA
ncbi:COQ9 family protein [Muricoccus radiodurans]|uniref:COQ9 family protein n=1 Tax=Muricoccus radiodurans TaxID=2231721 RepID=UPI003CF6450A